MRIGQCYGAKWPMAIGMLLCAVSLAMLALWHHRPWHVIVVVIVLGAGFTMVFVGVANIVVDAVRPTESGVATGMNMVMQIVGGVIGAQVGAAILSAHTVAGTHVPTESAFATAFWVVAAGAFVAAGFELVLTPRRARSPFTLAEAVE